MKMMKAYCVVLCVLLPGVVLLAGELLRNPELMTDVRGEIMHWESYPGVELLPGQGPEGRNAVQLTFQYGSTFKQSAITLVAGEAYRVSAYIKTDGFLCRQSSLVVWNERWGTRIGVSPLPNPCPDWTLVQAEVTMPESRDGLYSFALYIDNGAGKLLMSAPSLEPLSENAKVGSRPAVVYEDSKRLIPVAPRLFQIPVDRPELTFRLASSLPQPDYEVRAWVQPPGADAFRSVGAFPLADGEVKIPLGVATLGDGRIKVELTGKADGTAVSSHEYPFCIVASLPPVKYRKLNQLVSEVINAELENKNYEFVTPRAGWVYIAFETPSLTGKALLDDAPTPIVKPRAGEAMETMRYLSPGTHRLRVADTQGGRLQVRLVPELLLYPFAVADKTDLASYRWNLDFHRKHLFPVANSMNTFRFPAQEAVQEAQERGIRLLGSLNFKKIWRDSSQMKKQLNARLANPLNHGVTMDELFMYYEKPVCETYAQTLWDFLEQEKVIYTWIPDGHFHDRRTHQELFAAVANVSRSGGKVLYETYVKTQPTLKDMEAYFEAYRRYVSDGAKLIENPASSMMMIMSGLISCGRWNCYIHPEVDLKYFFDRFYHMLANAPEFDGLYGIGCYNTMHIDEENLRWIARLMRHYGIEGRRELLSEQYGFSYIPGHLQDGDFTEGFAHWQPQPAAEGTLLAKTIQGYGTDIQNRRSPYSRRGDHVAVFQRQATKPNLLSQTATGLQPERLYTLSYVVSDFDDIAAPKPELPDILLPVALEGAEVIEEGSYVNRWPNSSAPKGQKVSLDTHRILFRALREQVKITFRDWQDDAVPGGSVGQRQVLNFVNLKPYYEK